MKLLEIQSSIRLEKSISRALSHEFIEALQNLHPDLQHQQQDVGTPLGEINFGDPYLRSILSFIGIEEIEIVPIPNQFMDEEIRQQEVVSARLKLMNLAASW